MTGFTFGCLSLLLISVVVATPLDDYVNAQDPTFNYTHVSTINGDKYTAYVMELVSQTWLTSADSSNSIWKHWVTICVPHNLDQGDVASVYINGGGNTNNPPSTVDAMTLTLCIKTGGVTADIRQIPNEPITFPADPFHKRRTEDAIIAFTWWHFMKNTSDPNWLLRLPMTNAVVKCMDMIQDFVPTLPNMKSPKQFVIAGASKRGWTTWTTGAVDKRVKAIVPIVIPVLNMIPSINMLFTALGEWSFALDDYVEMGVIKYLDKPEFVEMAKIIDPFSYLDRLTMPKYLVCATGDEFFLPDSTRHFYSHLLGEKHLRMVPNAEHSLAPQDLDVAIAVGTWIYMLNHDIPIPKYSWSMVRANQTGEMSSITLKSDVKPSSVTVWKAHTLSNTQRDFRLLTCRSAECFQPIFWYPTELEDLGDGTYQAQVPVPVAGWTGYVVEVEYEISTDPLAPVATLKFTTEVNIVPDIFPFPPCSPSNGC
eukprot:TRINITY_DN4561_c0_g1_i1.p1 TRINITY_DN4561_c0_g1~~TRINITY_DN4561_c0_g1_i1.p1  ORF type:complete len:481 (-),score=107.63 TRINITY_DN4561_c0_g1_i1:43-1485(-)